MKKLLRLHLELWPRMLLLLTLTAFSLTAQSQVRIVAVDPGTNIVTLKNYGNASVDVSNYYLCALFAYRQVGTMLTIYGSTNIAPGDLLAVTDPLGFNLNAGSSDLGLYFNNSDYSDQNNMADFTQWGAGGLGREPVAVAKGIWTAGEFVTGTAPYAYNGSGAQNGASFWTDYQNFENIRIASVHPTQDLVTIRNYGGTTEDISSWFVCALFAYQQISNLTPVFGSMTLAPGDMVVLSGFSLNDTQSDFGLYYNSNNYNNPDNMADFTQWGAGGQGRESVAAAKGIWTAGDFVIGTGPFGFTGLGGECGEPFWSASGFSVTAVGNDPSCHNGCNGNAVVNTTGGNNPFSYVWGDPNAQTTQTATGLCGGTYGVIVIDSVGNVGIDTTVLANPTAINLVLDSVDATCGQADGQASIIATGGAASYTYVWSDVASQTTATATGLVGGVYTVSVTDASGCVATDSILVNGIGVVISPGSANESCGQANGSISATPIAGLAPFTFAWSNGQTDTTATGLAAGSYTVTVTDSYGCSATSAFTLGGTVALTASDSATNANCGQADGAASVAVLTGNGGYTYAWDAAAGSQTDSLATALAAGSYSVTISDAAGCTFTTSINVNDNGNVSGSVSATSSSCSPADGTATVTPGGGTAPFTYQWDAAAGSQTDSTATGLSAGEFDVTITDNTGCVFDTFVVVVFSDTVTLAMSSTVDNCEAGEGTATATPSGGTTPYTYVWDANTGSQTAMTATDLESEDYYYVTVTDATGCIATDSVPVTATSPVGFLVDTVLPMCGEPNGQLLVNVVDGTSPFTYTWGGSAAGQTTQIATGLPDGTATVLVTDVNGCQDSATIQLQGSPGLTVTASSDVGCDEVSITVAVAGGTPPLQCLWSTGSTDSVLVIADPGTYSVTCTDANGCSSQTSIDITDIPEVVALASAEPATDGNCNGEATASGIGGTPPFSFVWDDPNAQTTGTATGLCAGMYAVTITDSNGCTDSTTVTVQDSATGIWELGSFERIELFPNPAHDRFVVELQRPELKLVELTIISPIGQAVHRETLQARPGSTRIAVDASNYASGLYQVLLRTDDGVVVRKVLVY